MAEKEKNIEMENKKTTKKTAKKTTKSNKTKKNIEKVTKNVSNTKETKKFDMNELINVVCITNTPLVYESKSQLGYRIEWGGFLEENWIEYKELVNMRGSQKMFFTEPWIICDWDVLVSLKVDHYYKDIIDLENLDKIFEKSPKQLEKTLKIVPNGIKKLIVDRAFELKEKKQLDSIKTIETIEKVLNVDLSV